MLHSDVGYACPNAPYREIQSLSEPITYHSCGETEEVTLEDIICDDRPGQEDVIFCREVISLVKKAFWSLPHRQRRVAVLHFIRGQSQAAIAKTLNISRSAVCQILAAITLKLRQALTA